MSLVIIIDAANYYQFATKYQTVVRNIQKLGLTFAVARKKVQKYRLEIEMFGVHKIKKKDLLFHRKLK